MGGKSGGDSQVKQEPWGHQKPYLKEVFSQAQQLYGGDGSQYFPGQTYADMTPLQISGLRNMEMYGTQEMPGLASDSTGAYRSMLAAPDVANNPYVQDWAQAANRRLGEDFQEQILPGIQKNAIAAGGLGGTRQGVAEGIAAGKLAQAMGDQTANMYNQAYGLGLDQQARGLALGPQTLGMGLMPGQTQYDIGGKYQAQDQLGISEDMSRYFYNQDAGWNDLQRYMNTIGGSQWGGTTTTPNPESSPIAGAIGGGLTGLGAMGATAGLTGGSVPALAPLVGAFGGPLGAAATWGLGGALLGGLLS